MQAQRNSQWVKFNLTWLFERCDNLLKKAPTLLALVLLSFASCTKEDTDKSGSVVFWYGQSTSTSLQAADITSLTIYVDGEIVGTYSTNLYAAKIPDCGAQASVGTTKSLGSSDSKPFTYVVKDNFGNVVWDGSVTLQSNTCITFELSL